MSENPISLASAAYASFATFRKNGNTVETPVWFAPLDGAYYIFSAGHAGKIKRLRNSGQSKMAPCTVSGTLLGESTETQAVILESRQDIESAHRALLKKYGWQMRLIDIGSRISGKFNKRAYIKVTPIDRHDQ